MHHIHVFAALVSCGLLSLSISCSDSEETAPPNNKTSTTDMSSSDSGLSTSTPRDMGEADAGGQTTAVEMGNSTAQPGDMSMGTSTSTNAPDLGVAEDMAMTGDDASMQGQDMREEVDMSMMASSFDDDFDTNSLSQWSLRHQVEGSAAQYTTLDINTTTPGFLTIVPTRTPGWFADGDAPLVFKLVQGNFSVETSVETQSVANPGGPPGSNFNSAGLMARNPSGAQGQENHVMVNVGRQSNRVAGQIGSESKTTQNSRSVLNLQPGSRQGRLILCRVGNDFYAYRKLQGDAAWTQIDSISRPDLPQELQVGMVANGYTGPDLKATFDYVRLTKPTQESECTPSS